MQHIQWIFSGIGVAIISALAFWWRTRHQNKSVAASAPVGTAASSATLSTETEELNADDKRRLKERQRVEAQRVYKTQRVAIGDFYTFEMDIWKMKAEVVDIREVEVKQLYHTKNEMMVHLKIGNRFMFAGGQAQQVGENEFLIPKLQGMEEAQCVYGFNNDERYFLFIRICVLHINAHARTADLNFVGLRSWP
jgi:hypothetical protein